MYDYSSFFAKFGLVFIISGCLFIIINRPWKKPHFHRICVALFLMYMTLLLALTLNGSYSAPLTAFSKARARIALMADINYIPLKTIRFYFNRYPVTSEIFMVNIVGNVLMFIPWGFFLSFLWNQNRTFLRIFSLSLVLTVGIEAFQLFIGRTVDIDDIILNVLGSLLGYWLCLLIRKLIPASRKASL